MLHLRPGMKFSPQMLAWSHRADGGSAALWARLFAKAERLRILEPANCSDREPVLKSHSIAILLPSFFITAPLAISLAKPARFRC